MTTLRRVLGDPLDLRQSWFAEPGEDAVVVLREVRQGTGCVLHRATIPDMNVDSYRRRAALPARPTQRHHNTMISARSHRSGLLTLTAQDK